MSKMTAGFYILDENLVRRTQEKASHIKSVSYRATGIQKYFYGPAVLNLFFPTSVPSHIFLSP